MKNRKDPRDILKNVSMESSGCWVFCGPKDEWGYGYVYAFDGSGRRIYGAHRLAMFLQGVEIAGLVVMHKCDNPPCVNPEHLFVGTTSDNNRDCRSKGRWRAGMVCGERVNTAKLTEPDVLKIHQSRLPVKDLIKLYGVSRSQISKIKSGKTWRHLFEKTTTGGVL